MVSPFPTDHKPVNIPEVLFFMHLTGSRKFSTTGVFFIVSVVALGIWSPSATAYLSSADQIPHFTEVPLLNVTNATLGNSTILAKYEITPTPIKIAVEYKETLADVKGEMATGPRSIGVLLSPEMLVIMLGAAVAVVAVTGLFVWRKRPGKGGKNVEKEDPIRDSEVGSKEK